MNSKNRKSNAEIVVNVSRGSASGEDQAGARGTTRVYVWKPGRGAAVALAAVVGTVGVGIAVAVMLFFTALLALIPLLIAGAVAAGVFRAVTGRPRQRLAAPLCPKCGKPMVTSQVDEGQGTDTEYQFCPSCRDDGKD